MPLALMDLPHLKLDGVALSPRAALAELENGSETGKRIAAVIDCQGIVEMTKPNEARFRK